MTSAECPTTIDISSDESSAGGSILDVWVEESSTKEDHPVATNHSFSSLGSRKTKRIPQDMSNQSAGSTPRESTESSSGTPGKDINPAPQTAGQTDSSDDCGSTSTPLPSHGPEGGDRKTASQVPQKNLSVDAQSLVAKQKEQSAKLVQSSLASAFSRQAVGLGTNRVTEALSSQSTRPQLSPNESQGPSGPALKPMPSASAAASSRQTAAEVEKKASAASLPSSLGNVGPTLGGPTPKPMPSPVSVAPSRQPPPSQTRGSAMAGTASLDQRARSAVPSMEYPPPTSWPFPHARNAAYWRQAQQVQGWYAGYPTPYQTYPTPYQTYHNVESHIPMPTTHHGSQSSQHLVAQQQPTKAPTTLPSTKEAPQKNVPTVPRSPSAPLRYPTASVRKPVPDDDSADSSACNSPEGDNHNDGRVEGAGALLSQNVVTEVKKNDTTTEALDAHVSEDVVMKVYKGPEIPAEGSEFMTTRTKTGSLPHFKKRAASHGSRVLEVSVWNGVEAVTIFERRDVQWRVRSLRRPAKKAKNRVVVSNAEFDTRYLQYDVTPRGTLGILVPRRPAIDPPVGNLYSEAYLQSLPDQVPESTSSSRTGRNYQARIPPLGSELDEGWGGGGDDLPGHDTIWDPCLADEAEQRGEDIKGFLGMEQELLRQEFLMELLHMSSYSVATARKEYERILEFRDLPSSRFSLAESSRFLQLLQEEKKNFRVMSRELQRSRTDCMVHYYKWKGKETKRNRGKNLYCKLKQEWKSDYCVVCDDGGNLMICDGCHCAYHPQCLSPPLKSVPKGDWFCPRCTKSPVKPARNRPRQRYPAGHYARTPTSVSNTKSSPSDFEAKVAGTESPSAKRALLGGFSEEVAASASHRREDLFRTPTSSKSNLKDAEYLDTPAASSMGSSYSP